MPDHDPDLDDDPDDLHAIGACDGPGFCDGCAEMGDGDFDDDERDDDERDDGLDEHDLGRCDGPGMCDACDRHALDVYADGCHTPGDDYWGWTCPHCERRRRRTCARGTAAQRRATVRARIQRERRADARERREAERRAGVVDDIPW